MDITVFVNSPTRAPPGMKPKTGSRLLKVQADMYEEKLAQLQGKTKESLLQVKSIKILGHATEDVVSKRFSLPM